MTTAPPLSAAMILMLSFLRREESAILSLLGRGLWFVRECRAGRREPLRKERSGWLWKWLKVLMEETLRMRSWDLVPREKLRPNPRSSSSSWVMVACERLWICCGRENLVHTDCLMRMKSFLFRLRWCVALWSWALAWAR